MMLRPKVTSVLLWLRVYSPALLYLPGCPVGDGCKPLDSTWREEGVCAQFYCYEGELEDGFVTTDIVTEVGKLSTFLFY